MIASVPNEILDNNGLYIHLKLLNHEQSTEIFALKKQFATVEKEIKRVMFQTYKCICSQFKQIYHLCILMLCLITVI